MAPYDIRVEWLMSHDCGQVIAMDLRCLCSQMKWKVVCVTPVVFVCTLFRLRKYSL